MKVLTKASFTDVVSEREKNNLDIAYKAACEGIVLLKNDDVLPFAEKKVALFGAGGIETIKGGTGSGEVNERHSVSIYEGMKNEGWEITSENILLAYHEKFEKAKVDFVKNQRKKAYTNMFAIMKTIFEPFKNPETEPITKEVIAQNKTDNCVYVLSRQAGEGGDRVAEKGDMFVTDKELAEIKLLSESYKNFVLVINSGSQIDLSFTDKIKGIGAILFICQLGTQGGLAVADVLCGKVNPSGKTSDTWAKKYSDIPYSNEFSYLNGNLKNEYYKEGIYVGYRYFDSFGKEPRFPFGFGLSYTNFEISAEKCTFETNSAPCNGNTAQNGNAARDGNAARGPVVKIEARVKNTGSVFSGKEVVQLYVSCPKGKLDKEYQKLASFAKTAEVACGASCTVMLEAALFDLASYDKETGSYILEKGDYIFRLGNSSRNTKVECVVTIDETFVVSKHDNICMMKDPFKDMKSSVKHNDDLKGVQKFTLNTSEFSSFNYTYQETEECKDEKVQNFINKLSPRQMATICCGAGMWGQKAFFTLPGSVGNTTSKYAKLGLANVTLCDGPAGIRIQKRAALTNKGKVKTVDSALGVFDILIPDWIKKFTNGNPEKDQMLYQFTTAFPVAAALAQTWNVDLVEKIGKGVFEEMKEYGVTYWLAPALNIHRNPLCGRNFEYYSEDPLLSGEMAAAMTKGVQQEDGFYVTLKHFACNNQENNRNHVSSNLSERALREIYLRGFEIAIRKGKAKSVMTAYNRINGVYCPNSFDLCTKVLRNEWGFDGVVMTDWLSTMMGDASDALCMKAGNDLIMPGGNMFVNKLMSGLRKKQFELKDLRRCCSNVVRSIFASQIQKDYIDNVK